MINLRRHHRQNDETLAGVVAVQWVDGSSITVIRGKNGLGRWRGEGHYFAAVC